jgi:hypothetical protein
VSGKNWEFAVLACADVYNEEQTVDMARTAGFAAFTFRIMSILL